MIIGTIIGNAGREQSLLFDLLFDEIESSQKYLFPWYVRNMF